MTPFQYLGKEHRELSRMLSVLEHLASAVAGGENIDRSELMALMDYFRGVSDMAHHDKEETLLVPALVHQNMDWFQGPLADMRRDHRQERYLMRSLRHAALQSREWSSEDRRHFVSIVHEYAAFMRAHMERESQDWWVEAARRLPAEEQAALLESFQRFDRELNELPDYRAVRERALELLNKYAEPAVADNDGG